MFDADTEADAEAIRARLAQLGSEQTAGTSADFARIRSTLQRLAVENEQLAARLRHD